MLPIGAILMGLATPQETWMVTFSGANRAGTSGASFLATVAKGGALTLDDPGFGALYGVAAVDGWSTEPGSLASPAAKVYGLGEEITPEADITLYPHYAETAVDTWPVGLYSYTSRSSGDEGTGATDVRVVFSGDCFVAGYKEPSAVLSVYLRSRSANSGGNATYLKDADGNVLLSVASSATGNSDNAQTLQVTVVDKSPLQFTSGGSKTWGWQAYVSKMTIR